MEDLEGKVALVTGASSGIGSAIAISLAQRGAFVFLASKTASVLKTKSEITRIGEKSDAITCDLTKITSINNLLLTIKERTKKLDILVNVAGIWHGKDEVYANIDYEDFNQDVVTNTIAVGLTAPMLLVHGLLPLMSKGSKIINISGTFESGGKGWIPYYVSKRAIEDFTVGLAEELKDKNIQVNCVSPSDTATPAYKKFFPQYIDESISPQEVADQVISLCDKSNTQTGDVVVVKKDEKPFINFHY